MDTKSNSYKIKLGIFVTTGAALFIFGLFWIGRQKHLFDSTFTISSVFTGVSGLQVGNNVRFSGINVGTVDRIEIINDTSVKVNLIIEKSVNAFIKEDCFATIGSEGLMGDKIISITQGSPEAKSVVEGTQLRSLAPVETDDIMANIKVTTDNVAVITDQLAEIVIKINAGKGTLGRLLEDSTMAITLQQTMDNLKAGTKGFSENMEAAKSNFLLKGFFKRKQREQEKIKQQKEEEAKENSKKLP
jgi:phospholipid/cholesterol/gamma-HCH transport system substrate-binding protein